MIAFGSQRAGGADLATHLSNAEDNEYVEVADLRGAIAEDLHGAFSEWEAQAHAMTRAKNYLYSLSVNPDPAQGRLSREQYEDYIARAEESLGLAGQPRAVVFQIKEGRDGNLREHCHVVWSRTDIQDFKAIPISFDKQKLMVVAREFARDHGLTLPSGYENKRAKADQLSLYEKAQADQTGLSKEERMEIITDLWRQSDTPKAFIAALEDNGYMLATGKRPYVLVDIYGHMNALPKMIADKSVRTKDIRAFLEKDCPPEALPSVEEAREAAAAYRKTQGQFKRSEALAEKLEILKASQEKRREKLAHEGSELKKVHEMELNALRRRHAERLGHLKSGHAREDFGAQFRRAQNNPKGLAAFLAKASGIALIRRQLHKLEDRKRHERQEEERREMLEQQDQQRRQQTHTHQLQMMEQRRKEHAQQKIFEREVRSLKAAEQRERTVRLRRRHDHMPALHLSLGPPGRKTAPHLAVKRHFAPTAKELNVKARAVQPDKLVSLREEFGVAAKPPKKSRSGSGKDADFKNKKDRGGGRGRR